MMKTLDCLALMLLFLGVSVNSGVAGAAERAPYSTAETHRVAEAATYRSRDSGSEDLQRFGWYSGLHVGAVLPPDMEIRGSSLKADIRYDVGYIFDAVIGFKMPIGVRIESEFSYRNVETNSVYSVGGKTWYGGGIGGADAASVLVNGWYDFDFIFKNWYPYAGLGLGYTKLWINPGHSGTTTVLDSSDSSLVGQIGVGLVYRYTRDIELSFDYRYLRSMLDFQFYYEPKFLGANDVTYETHSFMLGFRGFF